MRHIRALIFNINMTEYNKINEKQMWISIINFYIIVWFNIRRRFCASLSVRVSDSGRPVNYARKYFTKKLVTTYTITHQNASHSIINLCIPIQFNIWRKHLPDVACTRKYPTIQICHNIHNYTHSYFTHHCTVLHTTKFLHQTEFVRKYIPWSCSAFPLGWLRKKSIEI